MRVQLFKLRAKGKKIPKEELERTTPMEGELTMAKYQSSSRLYSYAKVTVQQDRGLIEELCHLYEPKVISIEGDALLMDGVEKDTKTGEMFFQQWRCFVGGLAP